MKTKQKQLRKKGQKGQKSTPKTKSRGGKWLLLAVALILVVVVAYGVQKTPSGAGPQAKGSPFNGDRAFEDMKKQIGFGPRPSGSAAIVKTQDYIIAELQKAGLKPQRDEFEATTPKGKIKMVNIRAVRPGSKPTMISLTGHYDTKRFDFRFDGASDGASSAAWLLEMARATTGLKLENSLEFVFFDGEEAVCEGWDDCGKPGAPDNTYGSRYDVARRMKAGDLKQLKAMILVDMIGDKDLDIRQETLSTAWLKNTIWNTAHSMGFNREFLNEPLEVEDDHIAYLQAGVPSVDIIDFDYPDWHKTTDTLDKTSGHSLKVVGDVIYAALPEIDKHASQ